MAAGNSFDAELLWDEKAGGWLPSGPHDWRSCSWISVFVMQGDVVATAQGNTDPDTTSYENGDKRWLLKKPLKTPSSSGPLTSGPATAAAVALMRNADDTATRLVGWGQKQVTLGPQGTSGGA
jgi:hypothetical protein